MKSRIVLLIFVCLSITLLCGCSAQNVSASTNGSLICEPVPGISSPDGSTEDIGIFPDSTESDSGRTLTSEFFEFIINPSVTEVTSTTTSFAITVTTTCIKNGASYQGSSTIIGADISVTDGVSNTIQSNGLPQTRDLVQQSIKKGDSYTSTYVFSIDNALTNTFPVGNYNIRLSFCDDVVTFSNAIIISE